MYNSISIPVANLTEIYPEGKEPRVEWIDRVAASLTGVFASWVRPRASKFEWIIGFVNQYRDYVKTLNKDEILVMARGIGERLRREGFKRELIAQIFSLVREVAARTIGMPHFDVQLVGGIVLLCGMIAEMETGEGKTLVATLPACAAGLSGIPVHIITVNDYLAERDAEWMGPIYRSLGLSVGVIKHGMSLEEKRAAYRCNITYCTNKEVTFDYLRDRIVLWDRPSEIKLQLERLYGDRSRVDRLIMHGLHYGIVDEADSILIDEARTPLIISAENKDYDEKVIYQKAIDIARRLNSKIDFIVSPSERSLELTEHGKARIREMAFLNGRINLNLKQREELVRQALVALHLFCRDKQYLVKDNKVQIIDEYTGRLMPDRSWERGLHQLIELKEGCEMTPQRETQARISYQRFFRRYLHLAGMTGTAREVAGELWSIYKLRVVTIPTNRPLRRYYLPNRIYRTSEERWKAVVNRISEMHRKGRPVLVGTRSVTASEHLSKLLTDVGLKNKVLNARQDKEEAEIIAIAGEHGRITVATNMAGRGTDIRLGPGVAEIGGLHVIATERHEAHRIDRQLFGRCGRQGDPGTCEAIVSFEDELIENYVGRTIRSFAKLIFNKNNNILGKWIGNFLFYMAQKKAERLHTKIRYELLKMDEHMSDALAFTGRPE